jgi:pimeloyl-ACP methyl ester carboxylesterase
VHGGALEPVLARADLEGPRVSVLNLGGRANPDVLLVHRPGAAPVVVKDWSRRSAWVRALVAPLLARHELAMLERAAGIPGVPRPLGRIDRLALALEFVEGRPLRRRTHGRALPAAFFAALEEILDALAARGVAYLDLRSPSNVLVTPARAPALVDLGSALRLPLPGALRRALDGHALAKLRARFEERSGDPVPARAAPEDVGRDLKAGGTRFRVRERGLADGTPPVVLVGNAGTSARALEPIALDLAAHGRRTLSIDLPGFGGSRRRVATLAPARVAAQLDALLAALRVSRADVCAAGFGAFVAAELAARAPGRVLRWVAIDAADPLGARSGVRDAEALRARLADRLPRGLPTALRAELLAELERVPAENLALLLRGAPTPIGVKADAALGADEAFAPGRVARALAGG